MTCTTCYFGCSTKFCPNCGEKTPEATLTKNLDPKGVWRVTTEGDCEGRSIRDLGTHEGYLDEIAKNLSSLAYYALRFQRMRPNDGPQSFPPPTKEVCVGVDDLDPMAIKEMLKYRRIHQTEKGQYYQTLKLIF